MSTSHDSPLAPGSPELLRKLAVLQTELVDLAYELERQGRVDAADVAVTTASRIGELCAVVHPSQHVA